MSAPDRRLLRAACRLHKAYAAVAPDRGRIDLPQRTGEELQATFRAWTKACDRGWHAAAARQREMLIDELDHLAERARGRAATLRAERPPQIPPLRLLYEELTAADGEFAGVEFAAGVISVTTEPITLEGTELGRFKIRLHPLLLSEDTPYSIEALDPRPAASCAATTHPHVSDERLCPGEGRGAIAAALAEGRLFDFFTIVDRILHTYSVGAAFVELDQWYGVRCHDCDVTVDEEDACTCTRCEQRVCGDCLVDCGGCGEGHCSGCIDRCRRCDEYFCGGCLTTCTRCRRDVCGACCEDELCETCREEWEEAEHEAESEEASAGATAAPAEPAV